MTVTLQIRRHVDVFIQDVLAASYPIVLPKNPALSDQDFIEAAITRMQESPAFERGQIEAARFVVRI